VHQEVKGNKTIVAPISDISIGLHDFKLKNNQKLIATRKVESEIPQLLES
jgi:hypothetical protein